MPAVGAREAAGGLVKADRLSASGDHCTVHHDAFLPVRGAGKTSLAAFLAHDVDIAEDAADFPANASPASSLMSKMATLTPAAASACALARRARPA
jgi:hypothetical protein